MLSEASKATYCIKSGRTLYGLQHLFQVQGGAEQLAYFEIQ
jgi:hypothetical protein